MRRDIGSGLGGLVLVGTVLILAVPASAPGAGKQSVLPPRFKTPASALPHGGVGTPTTATSAPTTATPAPATPGATPAPGASTPSTTPTTPGAATPATPGATTTPGIATTPTRPAGGGVLPGQVRRTAAAGSSLSTGAIVAVVLAALLILLCAAWGMARWWAWEPHWALSARHSFSEAGLRLSATWGEFSDWARLGR